MKTIYPISAWVLWGFGLLLSLWFLYSSGTPIYRQWTLFETTARPMYFVQLTAAILSMIALVWLAISFKKEMTMMNWMVLWAVSVTQIIVALIHWISFWESFKGTTFG